MSISFDINKLKKLRQETGISFSLCKKALEESNNDLNEAKKLLQKWGGEKIADKQTRSTTQGAIFSYIHHNKKVASLVELVCETDFVAQNRDFQKLGDALAMQVASMNPQNIEEFLSQEYIRDPSKKIADLIKEAVLKFGENVKINRFIRWSI
ncbi:MAG: elongation factor Ts [Microgenomates group bacterium]